ncbi:MAG: hypothetical protein IJU68_03755 [Bacteroidales bacterium]|nr:hypothetical protein [Bacteroidales bacterium]
MKRIIVTIACAFTALSVWAQSYSSPTTTWPYQYADFTEGEILMQNGAKKTATLNVCLVHSTLHYIEKDFIKELPSSGVFSARIGEDYFINAAGRLMKILAQDDNGYVAEATEIDIAKLNSTEAAYGSSSTTLGTMALSSLEGIGATNSNSSLNHMELKNSKEDGKTLPLIQKKYLFVNGKCIYATKKDVSAVVDAAAFKSFLKENKVKWNNPQSLLGVVDFIAKQ